MIPILFDKKDTVFTTNGIGRLIDAISCVIVEERNGIYELTMQYPVEGRYYESLAMSQIILAKPNDIDNNQPFRIYKITKPLNKRVTVYAEHISYQLNSMPVASFKAANPASAMAELKKNIVVDNPFTFWTDKESSTIYNLKEPKNARQVLGGSEGSLIDVYGGELEFDNYNVKLHNSRGNDSGVTIRYGKNLTELSQDETIESVVTAIYPYWIDSESGSIVTISEKIVTSEYADFYPYLRIEMVDFSSEFEEIPTEADLRHKALIYINEHDIGLPRINLTISFEQLWQTEEYKDKALIERVKLCDYVTIKFEEIGIDVKAKVIETEYDVLREKYNKITLGNSKSNLSDTLISQKKEISMLPTVTQLQQSITNATNLITGNKGGYILQRCGEDGKPYEFLIMDTDDASTATKVWRWNLSGLGYSNNGINGPFELAMTSDGQIVANFITAGELSGTILKGNSVQAEALSIEYKNSVKEYTDNGDEKVTEKLTSQLKVLGDSITAQIEQVSKEVGKEMPIYSVTTIPTMDNYPADTFFRDIYYPYEPDDERVLYPGEWTWEFDTDTYKLHLGSIAYNETTGDSYKFVYENNVFGWRKLEDNELSYILSSLTALNIETGKITLSVQETRKDIEDNYYTKVEADSKITQTADSITQQVTSFKKTVESNYYTKTQADSKISQTATSISQTVAATYATKETTEKISGELELKVDKDKLISQINMSAGVINISGERSINISGNKLSVSTDNTQILSDGTIKTNNGEFSGTIKGSTIIGSTVRTISNDSQIGFAGAAGVFLEDGKLKFSGYTSSTSFITAEAYYDTSAERTRLPSHISPYVSIENDLTVNGTINGGDVYGKAIYGTGTGLSYTYGSFTVGGSGYNSNYKLWIAGGAYAAGNLGCSGTKNRIVDTLNHGKVLLNAYEMASPMFGDIGTGQLDFNGECIIFIDDVFLETTDTVSEYQVFLQKYGQGDIWVDEISKTYFSVKGTVPDLKFAWEIKAKQKDYATYRLENEISNNFDSEMLESDYVEENNEMTDFENAAIYETIDFEDTIMYEL